MGRAAAPADWRSIPGKSCPDWRDMFVSWSSFVCFDGDFLLSCADSWRDVDGTRLAMIAAWFRTRCPRRRLSPTVPTPPWRTS
jgi:hypothetical protein